MKIDFDMLDNLEAAGATAKVVIAMLRTQFDAEEARKVVKRPKDAKRKRERLTATKSGNVATASDQERLEATVSDTPRARLFREGVPDLIALNIAAGRSRSLIGSWLKVTHDDEQLVTVTIRKARDLGVADAPGWILAALQQAMSTQNGQRSGDNRTNSASGNQQSGSAAILAGVATAAERRGRERSAGGPGDGQAPRHADPAKAPDLELFGTGHG